MSKKYVHNINIRIDPTGIQLFGQKLVKGPMPLYVEEHVRCLVMCRGNDRYFDFDQVRYCYPQANEANPIIQPIKQMKNIIPSNGRTKSMHNIIVQEFRVG